MRSDPFRQSSAHGDAPGHGFVRGTSVYTSEGLRPIESIRIGAEVLCRPDNGVGERAYKRVTQTFTVEDCELYLVTYGRRPPSATKGWETEHLAVTDAHRFWVRNRVDSPQTFSLAVNAWTTARELFDDAYVRMTGDEPPLWAEVELPDGSSAFIEGAYPILKTAAPDIGIMSYCHREWLESYEGMLVRFTPSGPHVKLASYGGFESAFMDLDPLDTEGAGHDTILYRSGGFEAIRRKVYNLAVEDHHTFYVGDMGVLVHNASSALGRGGRSCSAL